MIDSTQIQATSVETQRKDGHISGKKVFKTAGAIIGFMIGAGFATGQETLQYFTSEGLWGVLGVLVAYAFVFFLFYCFMITGARTGMTHSKDVFKYYCGKYIGTFYEYATIAMLFLVTVTMVAGAGAIFTQYFGVSDVIGRLIICALILVSVLLGLSKLLDILGPLGPVIVVSLIVIAVVAIAGNPGGLTAAPEFIESCDPPILTASSFWLLSGILYGVMNIYPLASYGSALGAQSSSKKEAVIGAAIGAIALALGASFIALSQMANIGVVYDQAIPTLALVQHYMPGAVTILFAIVLLLGIYTTVTPNLWAVAQAFGEDKSKGYVIATVVGVVGVFAVSFLPYGQLLNFIYPFAGYLAYFMIAAMIFKHIRLFIEKRKSAALAASDAETSE